MIALESEVVSLKRKVITNQSWDKRYSKRMAVCANIMLGMWIFWYHFIKSIRRRNMKSRLIRVSYFYFFFKFINNHNFKYLILSKFLIIN